MKALSVTLVWLLALNVVATGQQPGAVRFAGSGTAEAVSFTFIESRSIRYYGRTTAMRTIDVTLDTTAQTSFYHDVEYAVPSPVTFTWSDERFVTGTFTPVTITTTVTFDPLKAVAENVGPRSLIVSSPPRVIEWVDDCGRNVGGGFDPLNLSGGFVVTGPTETYSGEFSVKLPNQTAHIAAFNVTDFPNSVTFQRGGCGGSFSGSPPSPWFNVYSGTVDGVAWDFWLDHIGLEPLLNTPLTLHRVPDKPGDADLDGRVTFSDFLILSSNFGEPGSWQQGDFTHDGQVDFADFLILSANYAAESTTLVVPEPSSLILLMVGFLLLRRRFVYLPRLLVDPTM